MEKDHLCESLMIWLRTFNVGGNQSSVEEIADGVAMANVLHLVAPQFFNDNWISKIKPDVSSNWRLKVMNLKKILKGILDYYAEVLGQQIQDFHMPDVTAIGEHQDASELGRLMQLLLGCAVNCDQKQEYIQRIMGMEESVQHVVMKAIQELMTKEAPSHGEGTSEFAEQLKRLTDDLNSALEQKDEIAQRCHELDLQVVALQEERGGLLSEVDRLNERLNQADSLEDPSTPAGRRYQQLQTLVEQQQEELFRLEASRDDIKIRAEFQEKELLEVQQKNEDLAAVAEEADRNKDEMDILRETANKVPKLEQTIETFKKKLEDLSDFKGQVKLLEEKNTSYMQTNMELEEEVRKLQTYKTQLDVYKRQVQELQLKNGDETKRADKAEFDTNRLQEKMSALQREKERLTEERDSLKDLNDELKCTQAQQAIGSHEGGEMGLEMMNLPPEVKERILRLQHENKMLRLQRSANEDEEGLLLQSMLDDANVRKNELESENRILNQRILELEANLEDLAERHQQTSSADSAAGCEIRQRLTEELRLKATLQTQLQGQQARADELEAQLAGYKKDVSRLQDLLIRKDEDMKLVEEKYKKYLDKARNVIKSLEVKRNTALPPDVLTLRNQLQEKERLLEFMEKENEKYRSIHDKEERLMTSAWYNLGMALNRKSTEDRLTHSGTGQSFLARQRQAHTKRPQAVANPFPAGSR